MTSEIVIMTPNAIAMAADSAVTVGGSKTYNGVNKLFMLSSNPPVGIMYYNNTSFLNIPFETIIKEFRESIKNPYNHFLFKKFLNNNKHFSTISNFQSGIIDYFKVLMKESDFKLSFEYRFKLFLEKIPLIINCIPNFYQFIIGYNISDEKLFKAVYDNFDEKYLNQCLELAINIFQNNYSTQQNTEIFINNFINYTIDEIFVKNYTGIVMSGFDENSLFPSCSSFKICYLYDEKYVLCDFQQYKISPEEGDVRINMFAQADVINTFLKSINPNTKLKILNYYNNKHTQYLDNIINLINNNAEIDDIVKQNIITEIRNYDNSMNSYGEFVNTINKIEQEEITPMLQSVGALPFVELSNLCESLIKITSLKRKVGSDLETVGGDVDVAIITKGDGFIWTKRKHYFDANLNPHFFDRKTKSNL